MTQTALIIAHGQPSDPDRAGGRSGRSGRPCRHISAGLACGFRHAGRPRCPAPRRGRPRSTRPGLPPFHVGGWFTRSHLPAKLAAAGGSEWQVLEPMGCDPALHDLILTRAAVTGASQIILAAHGSSRSSAPSDIAHHLAARITGETGIPPVPPSLTKVRN